MRLIPKKKYKDYLKYCMNRLDEYNPSTVICDCGKTVDIYSMPYGYDAENNDIYFGAICPECGELIITKE